MKNFRFTIATALLLGTTLVLNLRGSVDVTVPRLPLDLFPTNVARWSSTEEPLSDEARAILGEGDFLPRSYSDGTRQAPIGLFIAYFPTQRTGSSIHSPKNCLPGAGWEFESSQRVRIKDERGSTYNVGEYVISQSGNKNVVIYWYQAHGRSIAGEYEARAYMALDAVIRNRTDGALVRVISPVSSDEDIASARARAEEFSSKMATRLPDFIPN
jgi:EpsI family protein